MVTKALGAPDKLNLSGGTMTGPLTLSGNPTAALGAAPKRYADNGFAAIVIYSGSWPARPSGPAVVIWRGPSAPPIGGGTGAQASDIWIQTLS